MVYLYTNIIVMTLTHLCHIWRTDGGRPTVGRS
jgi:hypothetical protein